MKDLLRLSKKSKLEQDSYLLSVGQNRLNLLSQGGGYLSLSLSLPPSHTHTDGEVKPRSSVCVCVCVRLVFR